MENERIKRNSKSIPSCSADRGTLSGGVCVWGCEYLPETDKDTK